MDSEKLQRINELILDEEKIVTNISVVNELKITPQEAQSLLKLFIKQNKNLQITYLLSGVLLNSKGFSITLVQESNLKQKRKEFEFISNEIIYSIQKTQEIDFNLISLTDSGYTNGITLLTSKNSIKRKITKKIEVVESPAPVKKSTVSAFASFKSSDSSNSENSKHEVTNNGKINTQSSQKQQQKPKKGGIANFFTKAAAKPQNIVMEPEVIIDEDTTPNQDMQSFDDKMDVDVIEDTKEKSPKEEKIHVEKSTNKSDSKKRKKNNKNVGPNKKRKRIQQICDSDSDDMFGDSINGDIVEMSDEEPPIISQISKKKVRKAIDKVHVDEEGFVVTKTEYIYESEPEDEVKEIPESKPKLLQKVTTEKKSDNLETNGPTGKGKNNKKQLSGKQPTLMSFFKKA